MANRTLPVIPFTPDQFAAHHQCARRGWSERFRPDRVESDPESALTQRLMGRVVRDLGRARHPDALEVPVEALDPQEAQQETANLMDYDATVLNAMFGKAYPYQVPILEPLGDDTYRITTTTLSTEPKHHTQLRLGYLAYRLLVEEGLEVSEARLLLPNKDYTLEGDTVDPDQYFRTTISRIGPQVDRDGLVLPDDVGFYARLDDLRSRVGTSEAIEDPDVEHLSALDSLMMEVHVLVSEWEARVDPDLDPDVEMSSHCNKPNPCPLKEHCKSLLPKDHVSRLPHAHHAVKRLLAEGVTRISQIPRGESITKKGTGYSDRALKVHHNDRPFIDHQSLEEDGRVLEDGFHVIDFETATAGVPFAEGLSPYEPVAFQWSLHSVTEEGLVHQEFLQIEPGEDPTFAFMEALGEALRSDDLPILHYTSHERTIVKAAARRYPVFRGSANEFLERTVDLHRILKNGTYFKEYEGRYSLKFVGPTLLAELEAALNSGTSEHFPHLNEMPSELREQLNRLSEDAHYSDLAINNGLVAQGKWLQAMDPDFNPDLRERIREELLGYCRVDTLQPVLVAAASMPPVLRAVERSLSRTPAPDQSRARSLNL